MRMYYINHNVFHKGDVKKAWIFASQLLSQYPYIDTITLLVYQSHQFESFIQNELGINVKQCKEHIYSNKIGKKIQIHTIRSYSPKDILSDERGRELLIIIGVPTNNLKEFLNKSRVEFWIIIPWLLEENAQLLRIYNAIDIDTNEPIQSSCNLDERVKNAIEWIKDTSYPNERFLHPYDEDRLRQMANALAHYKVPFEYEAVVSYCIGHNIIATSAFQIAEYFSKAKHRKFATMDKTDYKFMKKMMERTDWE